MTEDLNPHLMRLANLLERGGMTAFLENPLLTPEHKWFPERWSPDVGAVRRLLLRFADYAGLAGLDVEVGLFAERDQPDWLPAGLASGSAHTGAAARFMGIQDSKAWFAVEFRQLEEPQLLLGVLAHEMAHAWRHHHRLQEEDRRLEEELTDLTTIALGWGILTCNSAYRYSASGSQRGLQSVTHWSHTTSGYLSVDVMAGLLAVYVAAREEDPAGALRHLGATQADTFRETWRRLQEVDLDGALGLPPPDQRPSPQLDGARSLQVAPGRAEVVLHAAIEKALAGAGPQGGACATAVPCDASPLYARHFCVVIWGRADAAGGWVRRLYLVDDPDGPMFGVLLQCESARAIECFVIAILDARSCADMRRLRDALLPVFDPGSPHGPKMFPKVPGFVGASAPAVLGVSEIETLMRSGMGRFEDIELLQETRWLARFGRKIRARLFGEATGEREVARQGLTEPRARSAWFGRPEPARDWWKLASEPMRADEELHFVGSRVIAEPAAPLATPSGH